MPNFAVASDALKNTFRGWRLSLVQLAGNAALFGLFVLWLSIPVATALHLAGNILLGALVVAATLLLEAGTLRYFWALNSEESAGLGATFRIALRHLPAFALATASLCLLWYFAGTADSYEETLPNYLRSMSPQFVRNLFSLHVYENLVDAGLFALQWIVAPGLVLPWLVATAAAGFGGFARRGFGAWKKCAGNILYWGIVAVCAVVGVYLIGKIMDWTPDFRTSTLSHETASLIWRGTLSYVLLIWAWLLACSMAGRLCGDTVTLGKNVPGQPAA